jgi:hypothetical protein
MKQFSKKEIEKRFYALYPNGELFKDRNTWCYTEDGKTRLKYLPRVNNYYDLAEALYLATKTEIAEMKRKAGYYSYQ